MTRESSLGTVKTHVDDTLFQTFFPKRILYSNPFGRWFPLLCVRNYINILCTSCCPAKSKTLPEKIKCIATAYEIVNQRKSQNVYTSNVHISKCFQKKHIKSYAQILETAETMVFKLLRFYGRMILIFYYIDRWFDVKENIRGTCSMSPGSFNCLYDRSTFRGYLDRGETPL